MQLRLTRRALDDVKLSVKEHCRLPATDYADKHDAVKTFVKMRAQKPDGQEWTQLPVTKARVSNLHSGRLRALTWHDEDSDVVWLLGVGWHESGSRVDAYEVLKRRDIAGILMPTEDDYLDLEITEQQALAFVSQVHEQAPALVQHARQQPGVEVGGVLAGRLAVGLIITVIVIPSEDETLEEIWVSFEMPPRPGTCELPPQPEWLAVVLAAVLPDGASLNALEYGGAFPRPEGARQNEIVVCWRSF